jgi:hypothetical protein
MKKLLQFLALCIFNFTVNAQFSTEWTANYQHTTANGFSNESRKVVVDASGNSFVLADVTSNKNPQGNITTSTWHYTVLSKYSPTGALLVTKPINVVNHSVVGFDNNGAFGMEIDAGNNIYIGYTSYDPLKNFDVNITKYKASTLLRIWTRRYNSTGADYGVDLTVGSGTVYALIKTSGATTTYRVIQANAQVTNDTALYSFTANTDVMNAIAMQGTSSIYVTGYRMILGYKSILTVKLNNAGSLKWTNTFDGGLPGDDYGKDIAFGADGNLYVAGSSWRASPNNFDVIVMKLTTSGTTLWSRFRDDNHHNDVGTLIVAQDMDYVYCGSTSANNIIFSQFETVYGFSGGQIVYSPVPVASYATLSGIELNDLKISTNHGFYLCGSVLATDAQGRLFSAEYLAKFVFSSPSYREAFVLDSAMPVAGDFANSKSGVSIYLDYSKDDIIWLTDLVTDNITHNQEKVVVRDLSMISPLRETKTADNTIAAAGEISISPNPSADIITVNSDERITKVELIDLTGKTVRSINPSSQKVTLNISGLMNGIYIGKIYDETGTVTSRKIIKN